MILYAESCRISIEIVMLDFLALRLQVTIVKNVRIATVTKGFRVASKK